MYTTLIRVAQLQKEIKENENMLLFDCGFDLTDPAKGALAFTEGHIPHAFYIDLEKNLSSPSNGKNGRHPLPNRTLCAEFFAKLGLTAETQVVVYDQGDSMFAARAWWVLRWLGHKNVAVLDGGLKQWKKMGGDVTTELAIATTSHWEAIEPLVHAVSVSEIVDNLATHEFQVIDARTQNRFNGESHLLDERSGHIPNAKNYFFGQNLNQDGF